MKCKNGVMLLEEKNCEPLDGEVDVLIENNSQFKVLERQLRLQGRIFFSAFYAASAASYM